MFGFWFPGGGPIVPMGVPLPTGAALSPLGGVFTGGYPLGGPLSETFRGGGGPLPPTLFISTVSPAGPIGGFFVGTGGVPIGVGVATAGGAIGAAPGGGVGSGGAPI